MAAYEKNVILQMKSAGKSKEEINKVKTKTRSAKLAIMGFAFLNTVWAADDLKKSGELVLKMFKEGGAAVWAVMYDTAASKAPEFIAKYSNNANLSAYIGDAATAGAQYLASFELGKTIGNKMIPFMYDFLFQENYTSASIINKKVSLFGSLEKRIKVYSTYYYQDDNGKTFDQKLIFDSASLEDGENILLYTDSTADLMHELKVEVYTQQKHVFDSERSPWEISTYVVPQTMFSTYISNQKGEYINTGLCVKKPLTSFLASFATYEFNDENGKAFIRCLDDERFSSLAPVTLDFTSVAFVDYLDDESLNHNAFKVQSPFIPVAAKTFRFYNGDDPWLASQVAYGNEDDIDINIIGYDSARFASHMALNSDLNNLLPITYDHGEMKDKIEVADFDLPGNDEVTKYIWSFSDIGTIVETSLPEVERPILSDKYYYVYVEIHTKNGNIIYRKNRVSRPIMPVITIVGGGSEGEYAVGDSIQLSSVGTSGADYVFWRISNNDTGEFVDYDLVGVIEHTFEQSGSYTITLSAGVDDSEESEQVSIDIDVIQSPYRVGLVLGVTAGNSLAIIEWDWFELGVQNLRLYYAEESGLTIDNYSMLSGSGMVSLEGVQNLFILDGLVNGRTYYFKLAADAADGATIVSSVVNAQPYAAVAATGKLNDTGITWGGNYPSGNNTNCIGETIAEQDCSQGRDADPATNSNADGHAGFSFTKLDTNGNNLPASATDWSCVKDDVTGLIWEVKVGGNGIVGDEGLHDADDSYNWYNTDPATNGGSNGSANYDGAICHGYNSADPASYCNTQAYVTRVNAVGLCGHHDWRLPDRFELRSIVDLSLYDPAIDTDWFPNAASNWFWSASPGAHYYNSAWYVDFYGGGAGRAGRYGIYHSHMRLVRGGQ